MIFTAVVTVRLYDYDDAMNDLNQPWSDFDKNHTIEADNKDEAEKKVKSFYSKKGDDYSVMSVDFFEHIS